MRHDWIFDVLTDLRSYAARNELHDLATIVDEALRTARVEIPRVLADEGGTPDGGTEGGVPPGGRPN